MSDAKVKAEARRAKILAREGTRLALAKGDIVRNLNNTKLHIIFNKEYRQHSTQRMNKKKHRRIVH
jgi:hypothetical protein